MPSPSRLDEDSWGSYRNVSPLQAVAIARGSCRRGVLCGAYTRLPSCDLMPNHVSYIPPVHCLPGRWKPDVLCPGIVGMRGSMDMRLRPCMIHYECTPPLPPWACGGAVIDASTPSDASITSLTRGSALPVYRTAYRIQYPPCLCA